MNPPHRGWLFAALFLAFVLSSGREQRAGAAVPLQTQADAKSAPVAPAMNLADLADYVQKQFGEQFKVKPLQPRGVGGQLLKGTPAVTILTGDLDGDGVEDAAIVAHAPGNPLTQQQDFGYRVIDPYDTYFGWGDPRTTRQFTAVDPENERALLVIHSWRSATPKAKYVIINLPFENLTLTRLTIKKKLRAADS